MILLTGATGTVGTAVLAAVADRSRFRLGLRQATDAPAGFAAVPFDLNYTETFAPALDGVETMFLLFPPQVTDRDERIGHLLAAATAANVRRIVFLSVRNADRLPMLPHRHIERAIEASGISWTHLRPNDFMQNFATVPFHRDSIRERGEIWSAAGRSKTSYVDVRDVGAVAVKTLTEDGHGNCAYTLTGPEELDLQEVAAILSEKLSRTIRYVRSSVLGFYREARRRGTARSLAAVMTGIGLVARIGLARSVDPTLAKLLGRKATSFERFVSEKASVWTKSDG